MRTIGIRYYFMQSKRAMKNLPYVILYLTVMAILSLALFKACVSTLATEGLVGKINIGIVLPKDDETADFAVSLVTSMDSVSSMCEFQYLDEASGREALKQQEIYALVLIPENLLEDILVGINTPVTILSIDQHGVETDLFREFAQMGIDLLGYAQMGVYAVDEYCAQDERFSQVASEMNLAINEFYIRYTFSRLALFKEKEISATGEFSFVMYYLCAGIVLLSILAGVPLAFYFGQHNMAFLQVCKTRGLNAWKRIVLTYLAIAVVWCGFVSLGYWLYRVIAIHTATSLQLSSDVWSAMLIMSASMIAFIQCIYKITQEKVWGILLLFFGTIAMMFVSGGFIPLAFLPNVFKNIAIWLPTTYWIRIIGGGIQSDLEGNSIAMVMLILIVCLALSCLLESNREYRDHSLENI